MAYTDAENPGGNSTPTETTALIPSSIKSSTSAGDAAAAAAAAAAFTKPSAYRHGTSAIRFWIIFSQVLIVQFLVYFDATVMASSHPVITSYFGAARAAPWLSTSFLLTSTAFQSLLGRISDSTGRKPIFVVCLVVFTLATSWCSLGGSMRSLIAARAFCGLGAGGLMTVGNIITSDLVPMERRGLYQPITNMVYGVGGATGAALGGFLAESLGWRWEFGIQVPALVLCLAISLIAIPHDIGLEADHQDVWTALRQFDVTGSILLASLTSGLILGLNLGGNFLEWTHPLVISSFAVFAISLPTFLWVESRVPHPIMPWELISHRPRANILFANFIAAALTSAILFNMPIYFRAVLLTSATSSGLRLVLPSVISSTTSALTGVVITWKRRLQWPLLLGAACYFIGMLPFCLLQPDLPSMVYFLAFVPAFLGQGFLYTGGFMSILAVSSQREQGAVISALLLWRNLGMVLGIASSSVVVQNALRHFLLEFVAGEQKDEVIRLVMTSIEAVRDLAPPYQGQVIRSFEAALHLMFACGLACAALGLLAVLPVRLPRLAAKSG